MGAFNPLIDEGQYVTVHGYVENNETSLRNILQATRIVSYGEAD